jgi:hypothetical protein
MATRAIVPRANDEGSIGTAVKAWGAVYATLANLASFVFTANNMSPTVDNTDSLGAVDKRFSEIRAVTFYGTATEALYADLAENFTIKDKSVPDGSVISVASGPFDSQICQEDCCDHVIGIISKDPAYIMNTAQKEGTAVCVKGRVPVRIVGPISKKQVIVSAGNGCARAVENMNEKMDKIGVALADNSSPDEKLVECFIY